MTEQSQGFGLKVAATNTELSFKRLADQNKGLGFMCWFAESGLRV